MTSIKNTQQRPDQVGVSGTLLVPWIKDFPGGVIDPDQVTDAIQVVVGAYTNKAANDRIILYFNGDNHSTFAYLIVNSGNLGQDIAFTIDKTPYIDANSRVEVYYVVQRATGGSESSETLPVTIRAGGSLPWPTPTVVDATGNGVTTLNPIKPGTSNEENTATLTVEDSRLKVGNVLAGLWTISGGAAQLPWVTVTTDGQVQAPVPREFIAAAVGKQVVVEYVVFRVSGGEAIGTSAPMTLSVLAIAQSALPLPAITEAGETDVLNVSRLTADATVTVAAWPFIDTSQRYWLEAQGTLVDGSETVITLAENLLVPSLSGASRSIPLNRLQALRDRSLLKLIMKVAPSGGQGTTIDFPIHDYRVRVLPSYVLRWDFESGLESWSPTFPATARLDWVVSPQGHSIQLVPVNTNSTYSWQAKCATFIPAGTYDVSICYKTQLSSTPVYFTFEGVNSITAPASLSWSTFNGRLTTSKIRETITVGVGIEGGLSSGFFVEFLELREV